LLNALRKTGRVGIIAMSLKIAATDEHDGAAVGGPGKFVDLLAIVIVIIREAAARVSGSLGYPDVASAMFI
jgi:hypothetical protein